MGEGKGWEWRGKDVRLTSFATGYSKNWNWDWETEGKGTGYGGGLCFEAADTKGDGGVGDDGGGEGG